MSDSELTWTNSPNEIDREIWERFVHDHPLGTIFQTPMMFEAFQESLNHRPFIFAAMRGKRIIALLSGVVMRQYSGLFGVMTARAIVWGGPLVEGNDVGIVQQLLQHYNAAMKKGAVYSQFRNLAVMEWASPELESQGFRHEDHLNIILDLGVSEEELWRGIHGKRKNEIRRAQREGTTFVVRDDDEALEQAYDILKEVYRHARLPFPDISLFHAVRSRSRFGSGLKIFSAENRGRMIGVMLALVYKERIFDWYAGAYRSYHNKYPNDLIPWEVMRWGKAHGFRIFDFGGAGRQGIPYGVRDYKKKFGGKQENFGRFEKVHRPLIMRMARIGFRLWRLVCR